MALEWFVKSGTFAVPIRIAVPEPIAAILGQICPQFTLLWLVLSVVGIVILDWMRYAVEGGEKPRYT